MKTIKLNSKHSFVSIGVGRTTLYWLLLDRLSVSQTVWGVFWTLTVIMSLIGIYDIFNSKVAEIKEDGSIEIK